MTSRKTFLVISTVLIFFFISACDLFFNESGEPINENIWVNAYLASWQHNPETELINSGIIKTSEIDWQAFTHLTYFSLSIAEDGTPALSLDPSFRHNFNSDRLNSIVPAAHENDTNILFSVGGGSNYNGFSTAITEENRQTFIATIIDLMDEYGFDGVNLSLPSYSEDPDLDVDSDTELLNYLSNFQAFVPELYRAMESIQTKRGQQPLLTISALKSSGLVGLYSTLQQYFDQINILTYNMAQPWRGWQTWHNSALYNKDQVFENNEFLKFPSIDEKVNDFINAGIDRSKLGITINFYGTKWEGVNLFDKWASWPTQDMSIYSNHSYSTIFSDHDLSASQWDENAKVPYLNLTNPAAFISYENDKSILEKIKYAQKRRLGGVMVWELGAAFFPENEAGDKDPLLQSIKTHAFPTN